jgi:hypothetical protein
MDISAHWRSAIVTVDGSIAPPLYLCDACRPLL